MPVPACLSRTRRADGAFLSPDTCHTRHHCARPPSSGKVVLASDGQVTLGQTVVKHHARKVRRLYQDKVLAGFAGTASDGFALFARFESKLEAHRGNLERASVELAREWRLTAPCAVSKPCCSWPIPARCTFCPAPAISSSLTMGSWALDRAARLRWPLREHSWRTMLTPRAIVEQAIAIAADLCIYTNPRLTLEEI